MDSSSHLRPSAGQLNRLGVLLAGAVLGSLIMAAAAHIKIPFWPVPMTLQVLATLLIGWFGGRGVAAASVALYLAEGALGAPVFAAGVGPAVLAGPTAGYLFGFLLAAVFIAESRARLGVPSLLGLAALNLAAVAIVYGLGWAWLSVLTGDPAAAFAAGVAPFLLGDALKIAVAAGVVKAATS